MIGIDLFCGCGGLSLGFQSAGIKIAVAYDQWEEALACYRSNFKHPAHAADVSDVDNISSDIAELSPDIIIGGPPCQDFSSAGKMEEKDRAVLTLCYARIIANVRPKWFVMENVDRAKKSDTYRSAHKTFKDAGYGITDDILNACHYNVPQKRKRLFCIGRLKENDGFLSNDLLLAQSQSTISVREYFMQVNEEIDTDNYYRHPRSYTRRGIFSIDEPSPTVRGVNRPIPSEYKAHEGDTADAKQARSLTLHERKIIQSFPPDFNLPESKTTAEQLLGNAVPVGLAKAVAGAIAAYEKISKEQNKGRKSLRKSIYQIDRDLYMRWLLIQGRNVKYAKDNWSWLQQAEKYIDLSDEYQDEKELIYLFGRSPKITKETQNISKMKKSLGYYWAIRNRLSKAKKDRSDLFL